MKISKPICIVFLCLASSGLKCKKDPEPPTYYLPQEVKEYMSFEFGTYWVYKDSVSNIFDSVIVTGKNSEFFPWYNRPNDKEPAYFQERFEVKTYSFYNNAEYFYRAFAYSNDCSNSNDICAFIYRVRKNPPLTEEDFSMAFLYPIRIGANAGLDVTLTKKYDSLMIGTKYYKSVIEYHSIKDATENNCESYFYVAKNCGIVKKRIFENNQWKTWELFRSNFKQ